MTLVLRSPGPLVFSWGPFSLRWYGLLIGLATVLGLFLARHLAARRGLSPEVMPNLLPWLVAGSLPFARLYYVVFEWERYRDGPWWKVLALWRGGMAIHGALLGGSIALYLFARRHRLNFWLLADCIVPSLSLGQGIGRWGNFFNNEAYGEVLPPDSPLWVQLQLPDGSRVHPTFLYESLWNFSLFGILLFLSYRRQPPPGSLLGLYLLGYSLGRFWIEGLRTDSLMLGSLRVAQAVSLVLVGVGLALIGTAQRRTPVQGDGRASSANPSLAIPAPKLLEKEISNGGSIDHE
ncbi:prolipoprotein diacylglyceryl transferase [Synechococcus sp. H65.1]|uniref:prolipoprotein diacylglyceryl transferase n=1 Tax=unclassified Synechococcus TaxID=2626047 RepID=UPI0039C201F7